MDEYLTSVPPPPVPTASPLSISHIQAKRPINWKVILGVGVGIVIILGAGIGTGVVLESKLYQKPIKCQLCSGVRDTSCPANQSCFVPDGQVRGVCLPVPKMGQVVDVAQVNQQCDTNFPSAAATPTTSRGREINCEQYGGSWLEQYQECERISKQQCNLLGGSFAECESACRHDPTADKCITLCVGVCRFP